MSKGWLYDWEGMATMGRQDLDTRFGRKLACSLSMFARDWRAPALWSNSANPLTIRQVFLDLESLDITRIV